MPGFLLGNDPTAVRAGLRESLRGLLSLDFDNLLFAHGEPLIGGGKAALRALVADGEPRSCQLVQSLAAASGG